MDREYAKPKLFFGTEDTAKLLRAAKMWQNLALAHGFNTIKWELEAARRNRSQALNTMTHWLNQQLSKGFNTWRTFYFEMLARKKALGMWTNRTLAMAWNTWKGFVEDL